MRGLLEIALKHYNSDRKMNGGKHMHWAGNFALKRRRLIRTVAAALQTDTNTAYHTILLNAALWDLHPFEDKNIDMVLKNCATD